MEDDGEDPDDTDDVPFLQTDEAELPHETSMAEGSGRR